MVDVKKVARLARLSITAKEEKLYRDQLQSIVEHFQDLADVNTDGVEPFISPVLNSNNWREDKALKEVDQKLALEAAPELVGQLFRVPPVV